MKKRFVPALIAAVSVLALLAGCTTTYNTKPRNGGQPPIEATAELEAIEGIKSASYESYEWSYSGSGGLFSNAGLNMILRIDIEDGYHINKPEEFLTYTSRLVWSINDMSPQGDVEIIVNGGISKNYTWPEMETILGEKYISFDENSLADGTITENAAVIEAEDKVYKSVYGSWPMDAPAIPSSLLVKGEPKVFDPLAITEGETNYGTETNAECWFSSFTRGINPQGAYYSGIVTFDLYDGEKKIKTVPVSFVDGVQDDRAYAKFCFEEGKIKEDRYFEVHATSEPQDGFITVNETVKF